MTNVNIGSLARATKWRKRYVGVWFGSLVLAELAAIFLTDLKYYKIADVTLILMGGPQLALYEHPAYLITIPILFLLIRMVIRFKITALVILSVVYLAFPIWPHFYAFIVQSEIDPDYDQFVLSAVFALPGLTASLLALINEMRYRAASRKIRYAGDLNLIAKKNRSKIFTLSERSIVKVLGPPAWAIVVVILFVFLILGFNSASARTVIWGVVVMLGWVSYMVHKHNVRTADEVAQSDDRPPILLLRSFKEDPRLGRPEDDPYTSPVDRVGQLLQSIGPLVALPEPDVSLRFAGVAEARTKNSEGRVQNSEGRIQNTEELNQESNWKDTFYRYMRDASLIVVFVSDGAGLLWEIEELITRPETLQRTVLIFPSDIKAQESANFIRFLLLNDKLPVAEGLYNAIKSLPRSSSTRKRYFSLDPCKLDILLPRRYVSDGPLLVRFSKCGDPIVVLGPLVWEGYKVAFKRYVLTGQ